MPAIKIESFSKKYRETLAVSELSLTVEEGEIYGFIGPNGSGKSTTIKALLDFIKPTQGKLSIFGYDSQKQAKEIRTVTGYVSSEVRFYPNFSAMELLQAVANFHQIQQASPKIQYLLELFEMHPQKKVAELSLGNRKKIALACSLLPEPRLLILDEPTSGLDPLMQRRLFSEIKTRNQQGLTVFLSSHQLNEIQENAHRAAFIRQGKLITVQSMAEESALGKLVTFTAPTIQKKDFPASFKVIAQQQNEWQTLYTGSKNELLQFLNRPEIVDFQVSIPSIEEQFMALYEGGVYDDTF